MLDLLVCTPESYLKLGTQYPWFYYDMPYHLDDFDLTTKNKGQVVWIEDSLQRFEFAKDDKEVLCQAQISHDLFSMSQFLRLDVN